MPIYKFKTFQEAEEALWNFNPDKNYFKSVRKLWEFAGILHKVRYPRGIFKFSTLEEAQKHREEVELKKALE